MGAGADRGATEEPMDTAHAKPALPVTLKSADWRFTGEQWCIPVRVYLEERGVSMADIAAKLKRTGNQFHYDGEWLEGAFYDSETESLGRRSGS